MATLRCSNILYNEPFNTAYDFSVSFNYTMDDYEGLPIQNNGFAIFFVEGLQTQPVGGGTGAGLSLISDTVTDTMSAVSGIFCAVGFDIQGTFCRTGIVPAFITGNPNTIPLSIGCRITPDFEFVSSVVPNDTTTVLPLSVIKTVRIDARNRFNTLTVSTKVGKDYVPLIEFDTSSLIKTGKLPANAKFGIGYSGDTDFIVSDITFNYTN
jgi:hypothetical protein